MFKELEILCKHIREKGMNVNVKDLQDLSYRDIMALLDTSQYKAYKILAYIKWYNVSCNDLH